jgi:hypothetical protein
MKVNASRPYTGGAVREESVKLGPDQEVIEDDRQFS